MALSTDRLGPYEVVATVGAGGMGEVYRARDPRLGREVAIKLLPASFSSDNTRLRRFEQEARAAAALNHPNILAVYDIGQQDGVPFIVSELLEGETLRERLRNGALPVRKAVDIALQVARGLAAAHEKGIVHRDLKPDNIFITRDGRAKILDFGLAKLTRAEHDADKTQASTDFQSDPGTVLGTVGYMSPEQVRGKATDARSDLFSFGAILYEMLSGKRAFHGETAAETMSAILKEEPPDLTETNRSVAPALERIVRHCLEKSADERFQSARDVAFDLETLSTVSSASTTIKQTVVKKRRRVLRIALAAFAALVVVAFFIGRSTVPPQENPKFRRLTFRRGTIRYARFAPDGHSIVYSAKWEGAPPEPFSTRPEAQGSIALGIPNAEAVSISPSGEMLVVVNRKIIQSWAGTGTLARVSMSGGAPRPIMENVGDADWAPDGTNFAAVRFVNQRYQLEYPVGKVLYETPGWVSSPRVSPDGKFVAFLDHPTLGDDRGEVAVIDASGKKRTLTSTWSSENGVAWSPDGTEIWFTASDTGINSGLYAVSLSGKQRLVMRPLGRLVLQDISRNGKLLVTNESGQRIVFGLGQGQEKERDLAFLDWTRNTGLSDDGRTLLFDEQGEGGGPNYSVYIRSMDGSQPTRLGEGYSLALSPDGRSVLTTSTSTPQQLSLVPVGAGEPRQLTNDKISHTGAAFWTTDGKQILFDGVEPGHAARAYIMDASGGPPRAITPEGTGVVGRSPDGKLLLAVDGNGQWLLMPTEGGDMRPVPHASDFDRFAGWAADGRSVYMHSAREIPARVYKVDLETGKRQLFRELMPADSAGLVLIDPIQITPDGKYYAYGSIRLLSDLYVVDGLK
jgi:serine/threonine protein kinase/Tol biopolymer transport system component